MERSGERATLLAVLWALFVGNLTALQRIWHPTLIDHLRAGGTPLSAVGLVMFVVSIPWILRPVWAAVSDRRVVRGRRHHLLVAAGAILFAATCLIAPRTERFVSISVVLGLGQALVTASVVGIAVRLGRAAHLDGPLAAAMMVLPAVATIVWPVFLDLADGSLVAIMAGAGLLTLTLAALAWPGWKTPPLSSPMSSAVVTVRQVLTTRALWMTALVLAVVQTSLLDPAASVTLSKILSADMHERAARFAVWGTAAGAVVYALAGRALPLRRLLPVAIVLATAAQLVFVSMLAPASAVLACAIAGVGYALLECALLHLTMRAAPTGHEAFVFTVLVGAHAIGRTSFLIVAMRFLGTGDMSAAPAVAIVAGAVALLATRLLPREVVDPHA